MAEQYENNNPRPRVTADQWAEPCRCSVCGEVDTAHSTNLGARKICGECVGRLLDIITPTARTEASELEDWISDISRGLPKIIDEVLAVRGQVALLTETIAHQAAKIERLSPMPRDEATRRRYEAETARRDGAQIEANATLTRYAAALTQIAHLWPGPGETFRTQLDRARDIATDALNGGHEESQD